MTHRVLRMRNQEVPAGIRLCIPGSCNKDKTGRGGLESEIRGIKIQRGIGGGTRAATGAKI